MKQQLSYVTGLILSLTVAIAVAAPPRFSGAGDSPDDVTASDPPQVTAATTAFADDGKTADPVADKAKEATAEASKPSTLSSDKQSKHTAQTATAPTTKYESWWSKLFHKHPAQDTQKKPDALVNTYKRRKEVYDLSRSVRTCIALSRATTGAGMSRPQMSCVV